MSSVPIESRERPRNRHSVKRMLSVVVILTAAYSLMFTLFIGLDTPEKSDAFLGFFFMFLVLSVASATFAEIVLSRRKERTIEEVNTLSEKRGAAPSLAGFSSSGRGWGISAALLVLGLVELIFVVGPMADSSQREGFPEIFRWLMAVGFVASILASITFMKKRSITVDWVGIRCEGRILRNFAILWTQVAKVECFDIIVFSLLGRGKRPLRNYVFKAADGRVLGFINPSIELKSSEAQNLEKVLFEQAAAHNVKITAH